MKKKNQIPECYAPSPVKNNEEDMWLIDAKSLNPVRY